MTLLAAAIVRGLVRLPEETFILQRGGVCVCAHLAHVPCFLDTGRSTTNPHGTETFHQGKALWALHQMTLTKQETTDPRVRCTSHKTELPSASQKAFYDEH